MTNKPAVILLAHGSRDPHWVAPFTVMLEQIRQQSDNTRVELAYLELSPPSLEQMVEALVGEGVLSIEIIPLFFAAGRHLRKDVPIKIDALQQSFLKNGKDVKIELHSPIGLEPEVATAISQTIHRKINQ